jgi:hypothetical protein
VKLTRAQLLDVLTDELGALLIWQGAKLPKDVEVGVGISISKITAALEHCGRLPAGSSLAGTMPKRKKHSKR